MQNVFNLKLKAEFDKEIQARAYFEQNWLDYAGWTLPHVYPVDRTQQAEMQNDYQSLGAQATNNLANKIASVLFQPGKPFFRLDLSDTQLEELIKLGIQEDQVQEMLSAAEKAGMKELAKAKLRTAILQVIKALIILGNSLLFFPDANTASVENAQVYSLRDYITIRDMSGNIYKIITRDTNVVSTLPQDIQELVKRDSQNKLDADDKVVIYTGIERTESGKFIVWQELDNIMRIPRKIGMYTEKDLPWVALTWNLTRGNNYGTGLVEEYSGDFYTYSSLAETLVDMSSIIADIKILVNPMGQTDVTELNESESGTYIHGLPDDISYLQLERSQDMQFLLNQMESYSRRIGAGFLFNSAVTRNAERVTAEEIRLQINELESSLGGVYSRLAEEMQLPIARKVMRRVSEDFKDVVPIIITGVESLSRTSELDQVMLFFNDLAMLASLPPEVLKRLNFQGVISKLGASRQVDYKDMLLDEDTVKQNDEALAQQEAQAKATQQPQQPDQPMV